MRYTYDELNRLINVNDSKQDVFDEIFAYDAQGRITAQRRAGNVVNPTGGEYSYYSGKNRLKSVADNMGGTADERNMSDTANFVYDSVGNLTYDKYLQGEGSKNALVHFYCRTVVYCALRNSKEMKILYDWRGMPIEFIQQSQPAGSSSDTLFRLLMKYDGTGRRISKTVMHKVAGAADWDTAQVTHYTGIGTEVRENYAGPTKQTKVVVNMPQGLGRYGIEDAENPDMGSGVGYIPNTKFEWYLKNHLGSTMLVYGTQADANPAHSDIGTTFAAYDYRAFGEMVELLPPPTGKVTENFTGKEHDDEIALDYFGARYLDPMLGMWISVDPARQFSSPYLYAGNGFNPMNGMDSDGNIWVTIGPVLTSNNFPNIFNNYLPKVYQQKQMYLRKVYGIDPSQGHNVQIRHIVQRWEYDPNASDEVNSRHQIGTVRFIDQVLLDKKTALRLFKIEYANEFPDMRSIWYNEDQPGFLWHPTVFDNTYHENPNATIILPNSDDNDVNVEIGEMICEPSCK